MSEDLRGKLERKDAGWNADWHFPKIWVQTLDYGSEVPTLEGFVGEMKKNVNLMELLDAALKLHAGKAKVLYIDAGLDTHWSEFTDATEKADIKSPPKLVFQPLTSPKVFNLAKLMTNESIKRSVGLRLYQEEALLQIKKVLRPVTDHEKFMVLMPTGTGKSRVIGLAPYMMGAERVLVLLPNKTLVNQIKNDLVELYQKLGNLLDTKPQIESYMRGMQLPNLELTNIITTNVQFLVDEHKSTMYERGTKLLCDWKPDLLIFDEGHHVEAQSYQRLIDTAFEKSMSCKAIYCTATPMRGDGKRFGLTRTATPDGAFFSRYTRERALLDKNLKETQYKPIMSDGKKTDLKLDKDYKLTDEVEIHYVEGLIVPAKEWLDGLRTSTGRPLRMLVTVRTAKAAEAVATHFNTLSEIQDWKLRAKAVTGETAKDNEATLEQYRSESMDSSQRVDVVVQCKMLGEGYNNPHNVSTLSQFHGRALRLLPRTGVETAQVRDKEAVIFYPEVKKVQHVIDSYKKGDDMTVDFLFEKLPIEDMKTAHKEFGKLSSTELQTKMLNNGVYQCYHDLRREEVSKWNENPAEVVADKVSTILPDSGDFKVIDFGCGPDLTFENRLGKIIEKRTGTGTVTVAAIDFEAADVDEINNASKTPDQPTTYKCQSYACDYKDVFEPAFLTESQQFSFDAAVFCLSFSSADALEQALLIAAKALKPAGKIFIVQPYQRFGMPFELETCVSKCWASLLKKETNFCLTTPKEVRRGNFVHLTLDNTENAKEWIPKWPQWILKWPKGYRKSLRSQVEQSKEFKDKMNKSSKRTAPAESTMQLSAKRARTESQGASSSTAAFADSGDLAAPAASADSDDGESEMVDDGESEFDG